MARQFVRPVALEVTDHNFLRTEVVIWPKPASAEMSLVLDGLVQGKSYPSIERGITAPSGAVTPRW